MIRYPFMELTSPDGDHSLIKIEDVSALVSLCAESGDKFTTVFMRGTEGKFHVKEPIEEVKSIIKDYYDKLSKDFNKLNDILD